MVKVRIEGTTREIDKFYLSIKENFTILSESKNYENRNSVYQRKYLEIEN